MATFSLSAQSNNNFQLVQEQIERYAQTFPEIEFILLDTVEEYEQLLPFTESLGHDLRNLDYEHPEESRITLVEAQQYRIATLLYNGMGSSTFFETPNAIVTNKPYTCLLTLNHPVANQKPLTSTRFMYDLDEKTLRSMPESLLIDNQDFLLFTLDHEVFHCVDAYTNGHLYPQTMDSIQACADRARAESRSDIYAALAHLSRNPDGNDFLINLSNAKTMNLLNWDVAHYTNDVLSEITETSQLNVTKDIKTSIHQAMQIARKITPTDKEHIKFLTAAWHVVQKFGLDEDAIPSEYSNLVDRAPDPDIAKTLSKELDEIVSIIYLTPYQD